MFPLNLTKNSGQTGAGKTYTVIGDYPENIADMGAYHKFLTYLKAKLIIL